MANARNNDDKREAQRILDRIERESETFGTSSMARTAGKVRDHFMGKDAPADDRVEVLGKRIARVLALIAVIALATSLYVKYIAPQ